MFEPHEIRVTSYLPTSGHGAGGMAVGLTTSGIIAHHISSGLGVSCDSERSQYANKEKALKLLEGLVFSESSKRSHELVVRGLAEVNPAYPFAAHWDGKVRMIKDVRQAAGCGLKEAKEAVDKMGTFEGALLHLTGSTGYCNREGGCVCGGDLPAIREGCYNWQK